MKYVYVFGFVAVLIVAFAVSNLFSVEETENAPLTGTDSSVAVEEADAVPAVEMKEGQESLLALQAMSEDLECTVEFLDESTGEAVEGTLFTSDGNVRGDFITSAPDIDGDIVSSLILDGSAEMMYAWSVIDGEGYGLKVDISATTEPDMETNQAVPIDSPVLYECKTWAEVDRTVFIPPTSVLFQDFGALMQSGMEYGTLYEGAEMPW